MTQEDELYSIGAAARLVGLSTATLRRYVEKGALAAVQLPSGRLRFQRADLETLVTPTRHIAVAS